MKLIKDLGMRYATDKSKQKTRFGIYECPICKVHFEANSQSVIHGKSTKCQKCKKVTHNKSKDKIYYIWSGQKQRCFNKKREEYKNYGARGITMSSEFKNSFETWLEYISSLDGFAELHKNNLEIDRIDNNKGYERGNLRIVDRATNSNNTRKRLDNKSGYTGVYFDKRTGKWYGEIVSNSKKVYLGSYNTPMECAKARDTYIVDNNLDNKKNLI